MGRRERCWQCDRRRTDVSLRICDDRLCQDCDDINRTACAGHARADQCSDAEIESATRPRPPTTTGTGTTTKSTGLKSNMADSSQSSSKNDNNNGVVIDELLCFVQNKIDLLPPTAIADLCTATFQDGDIEASKRRLFELCADENCTRLRKRQGPHKTTKNIDDIVRLMQEKGTDTPTFVALNLAKLPPVTFDSIDVSALLHSIQHAQFEIDLLRACVQTQQTSSDSLREVVGSVSVRLAAVESATVESRQPHASVSAEPRAPAATATLLVATYDDDETLVVKNRLCDALSPVLARDDWPAPGELPAPPSSAPPSSAPPSSAPPSSAPPSSAPPSSAPPSSAPSTSTEPARPASPVTTSDDATWSSVARRGKPKGQQRRQTPTSRPHTTSKGITGSAKGSGIKSTGVKRFANVFATRFESHVTADDIATYLRQRLRGGNKLSVERVATKYNYASFHITCECADTAIFMDPSLWPEDIFVRWWRNPRLPSNTHASIYM